MIGQSLKAALWMLLLAGVVLLALAGMVAQGWTEFIVPTPGHSAEMLVQALGAHRYTGAMNQLSQDLQQQVEEKDLRDLVKRIEASPAQGIQDAHEQGEQEHGSQATAQVQVKLGSNRQVNIELPLKQENGLWKVTSIEPLLRLGQ